MDPEESLSSENFGSVYGYGEFRDTAGWDPEHNSDGSTYAHPQGRRMGYGIARYQRGSAEDKGKLSLTGSYGSSKYADRYRKENRNRVHQRKPGYASLEYDKSLGSLGAIKLSSYYEDYSLSKTEERYSAGVLTKLEKEIFDTQLYGADFLYSKAWKGNLLVFGVSHQGYKAKNMTVQELFPLSPPEPALRDLSAHPSSTGVFAQDAPG